MVQKARKEKYLLGSEFSGDKSAYLPGRTCLIP